MHSGLVKSSPPVPPRLPAAKTTVTNLLNIDAAPGEICVVPRGVKFRAELPDGPSRGYVCENYGAKFTCPERGPIGANCLANRRDFLTPVAAFEEKDGVRCRLVVKWDLENRLPMKGTAARRIVELIEELEFEGLL